MEFQLNTLLQTRKNLLTTIKGISHEDLIKIPKGFNNNIAWNFNHCILVMYLLVYKLSGLEIDINEELVARYMKGAKVEENISKEDVAFFKSIAISSVEKLKEDYKKGIFKTYHQYPTSYNITLTNIEEAISFNSVHEAMHLGYIFAQKRALNI